MPWALSSCSWYRLTEYLLACATAIRVSAGACAFRYGRVPPAVLARIRWADTGRVLSTDLQGWNHSSMMPSEDVEENLAALTEIYNDPLSRTLQTGMWGTVRFPQWSAWQTMEHYQEFVVAQRPCRTPSWPQGMPQELIEAAHQHWEGKMKATAARREHLHVDEDH